MERHRYIETHRLMETHIWTDCCNHRHQRRHFYHYHYLYDFIVMIFELEKFLRYEGAPS